MQIITGSFPELNIKIRRPTTIFMKTNDQYYEPTMLPKTFSSFNMS